MKRRKSSTPEHRRAVADRLNDLVARHGDAIRLLIQSKVIVRPSDGCWLKTYGGAGVWSVSLAYLDGLSSGHAGWMFSAHRISFAAFNGAIDGLLDVDHVCRNRGCVNPAHLEQVTRSENIIRSLPYRVGPWGSTPNSLGDDFRSGIVTEIPAHLIGAVRQAARAAGLSDAAWIEAAVMKALATPPIPAAAFPVTPSGTFWQGWEGF